MIEPLWTWRLRADDGSPAPDVSSPAFSTRFDAEHWLGAHWRDLAAQGVGSARLRHEGADVGAPLPLATDEAGPQRSS